MLYKAALTFKCTFNIVFFFLIIHTYWKHLKCEEIKLWYSFEQKLPWKHIFTAALDEMYKNRMEIK